MRGFGIGLVNGLLGGLLGIVAALLFLAIVGRVIVGAAAVAPPEVTTLGTLLLGLGIGLFPFIIAIGARSPRSLLRRSMIFFALEGLILAIVSYLSLGSTQIITGISLGFVPSISQAVADVTGVTGRFDRLVYPIIGGVLAVVSIVLFFALRGDSASASTKTAATPSPSISARTGQPLPAPSATTPLSRPAAPVAPPQAKKPASENDLADIETMLRDLPKKSGSSDIK